MQISRFVDSHTEGEPTRVLLAPDDGAFDATLAETIARFSTGGALTVPPELRALAANPRAADATVCALLTKPSRPGCAFGVLFWNAAAALGMCGHATIGLARTLVALGRLAPGSRVRFETRVGEVEVAARADGLFAFENVPSRAHALDAEVVLAQGGVARGDIAWGGNWFFIVRVARPMRAHAEELAYARAIEAGIERAGLRAGHENGGRIDHVALVFPPSRADANARNFVLCPNGTYDRSPCGTGTSALLASLAARGELAPGAPWRQESAIGSIFEASYARADGDAVTPTVAGRAWIVARGELEPTSGDPLRTGNWKEDA